MPVQPRFVGLAGLAGLVWASTTVIGGACTRDQDEAGSPPLANAPGVELEFDELVPGETGAEMEADLERAGDDDASPREQALPPSSPSTFVEAATSRTQETRDQHRREALPQSRAVNTASQAKDTGSENGSLPSPPDSGDAPAQLELPPPATSPAPEVQAPDPFLSLDGRWRYAGGASQRARLEAAVEETAEQFVGLFRGFAKKKLLENNVIHREIRISYNPSSKRLELHHDDKLIYGQLGQSQPWKSPVGDPLVLTYKRVGDALSQDVHDDRGGRRNLYRVDASGDRLTLSVTMYSPRLDEPLRYRLSYRRAD